MTIESRSLSVCGISADGKTFEHSTDPATTIVTLRTPDGFQVCFAVPRLQQIELSEALAARPAAATRQVN